MGAEPEPVLPAYGGACVDGVMAPLLDPDRAAPGWIPEPAREAGQVVLLVLDGLGWEQLQERRQLAPTMTGLAGGPITTVAPSTTATALTSITTGLPPAAHGVVGYRVRVGREVLNVLRWRTANGDARGSVPPEEICYLSPFCGTRPPVVTRAEFSESGFTGAHLSGTRLHGWRMPSTLVVTVRELLALGEPFVYAYYDGVDKVAHEFGLGAAYDAELAAADRLVSDLLEALPAGAALVVVSDHGQVDVGDSVLPVDPEAMEAVAQMSGEGRFRWLHARPGTQDRLLARAREGHGDHAWVVSRAEAEGAGWFGGRLRPEVAARLGDVAIVPHQPVAVVDPDDTGNIRLRSRHGSLTSAEMLVPLLAARG